RELTDHRSARLRPGSHRIDHPRGIRPAAPEEPREESAAAGRDELSVDQDVEAPRCPDLQLRFDSGCILDVRGETRRARSKASSLAVADVHVHGGFMA